MGRIRNLRSKFINELKRVFLLFSVIYTITTILFTSTALLILPFVTVYTKGVTDVNYYRPLFAYIFTAAEAVYCIRLPYHAVVLAAGHFKQTRNGAFMEAFINISLSFLLVNFWGLVGVVIGTFCAMLFRTIQYAVYLSKHILVRSIWIFIKRLIVSIVTALIIVLIVHFLPDRKIDSYLSWLIYAVMVGATAVLVTFGMNALFYFENLKSMIMKMKKLLPVSKRNNQNGKENKL
jgi:hypothetical protein